MEQNIIDQNEIMGMENLPNSTAVLVLGILSIVLCFCYGFPGLTLGIISIVLSNKDLRLYRANPGRYRISSYKNLNAGRVCAIIGTSLSSLYVLIILFYAIFVGTMMASFPWESMGR
ncbi:MAG: CCC motif membrane protein [Bacteroidota bacterium]